MLRTSLSHTPPRLNFQIWPFMSQQNGRMAISNLGLISQLFGRADEIRFIVGYHVTEAKQ